VVRRMGACHAGCVECFRRGLDFGLIGRERAETVGSGDRGLAWPRPPMGAAFGLAVAFFCLLGSQGDPRPLATYGLVLATPLVLLLILQTRSAWLAASFLVFLGIAVRLATLDRHYFGSDVILVTREALRTILDGHNPYGHHYVVSDNPFAYPPGNLLYYLPGYLMDDTRATEIFSSAVVLIGLAWVAARTRSDGVIASLGLYAAAPPLIAVATDGSNDTSAGAILFVSVLALLCARRGLSGAMLVGSGILMGEALSFKQYALPFWPLFVVYLASTKWDVSITVPGGRMIRRPAWLWYAGSSLAFVAITGLPFLLWSPTNFISDLTAWWPIEIHPIEGWNIWAFLLEWLGWDAQGALGDWLVAIDLGLTSIAIMGAILIWGVANPSRALVAGVGGWFVLMLFARWTTYAYFAGVAPVILLIPFADGLAEGWNQPMLPLTAKPAGS